MLRHLFGGRAQVAVGAFFLITWIAQWVYWSAVAAPTVTVVFHISMEAGVFAAYAVIATGLAYIRTERVEAIVDPELDPD